MIGLMVAGMLGAAVQGPMPRASYETLFGPADYPTSLVGGPSPGPVTVRLAVAANGRVAGCAIVQSSGAAALDTATCRLLISRARFIPARDADGNPTAGEASATLAWTAPAGSGG
jgi:protein TonB